MSPQYPPATIDGSEIPADAPRSQGMSDETAALISAKADEFRGLVLHCHFDLTGRDLTAYAANVPGDDGTPVMFNFGDGSAEVSVDSASSQGSATHTYLTDGVFLLGVRTPTDRWFTEVAINWPPYEETPA